MRWGRSTSWRPSDGPAPEAVFVHLSTNKVYGDAPNELPVVELPRRWEYVRRRRSRGRHRGRCAVDQTMHSRLRGQQGGSRRDGPGVWPLLRPEDHLPEMRLPDGPEPLGRPVARLPLLPRQGPARGPAVHDLRLQGQAGPRQYPQRRHRAGDRGDLRPARDRGGLQSRRRAGEFLLGPRGLRPRRATDGPGDGLHVSRRTWQRRPYLLHQQHCEVRGATIPDGPSPDRSRRSSRRSSVVGRIGWGSEPGSRGARRSTVMWDDTPLVESLAARERLRDEYGRTRDPIFADRMLWRAQTFRHLVQPLPGQRILELGSGQGVLTRQLAKVCRGRNPITALIFDPGSPGPSIRPRGWRTSTPATWPTVGSRRHSISRWPFDILDRPHCAAILQAIHELLKPGGDGLPDHRPDGRGRLLRRTGPMAPSRRAGLPALPQGRPDAGPPQSSRPGARLSLRPLPPHLQRLYRDDPARHPATTAGVGPDRPRLRPGRPHGATGPRVGLRPRGVAEAAAPAPGRWPTAIGTSCRWTTGCWRPMRPTRMRGKKGVPHRDPDDPPRRRANALPGHGTWANDRPPVCGTVGRESGRISG